MRDKNLIYGEKDKPKKRFRVWHALVLLLGFILTTVAIDYIRNSRYETLPMRPDPPIQLEQDQRMPESEPPFRLAFTSIY